MKNKNSVRVYKLLFCTITTLLIISATNGDTYAEHSLGLTTSGSQTIDVASSGNGATISKTDLSVTTTCQAGYNLSLSTSVNDNRLYFNGDSENLATGNYFSPSDGTTSLASANNTWGYYLPSTDSDIPTTNSVFSAVPTLGNAAILRTPSETASDTEIDDTFSIYYGVKVTNSMSSGSYTMVEDENHVPGTLVYYATLPEDCFRYTIEYDPTGTNTGIAVTGTGAIENQYALEGTATAITSEVYEAPVVDGITYYFTGWNTIQNGTGIQYASGESVTDLAPTGTTITLYAQWASCQSGKICYQKNHSDVEGAMDHQTATSNTDITLSPSNYLLDGYGFIGWSEDKDAATKLANREEVTIYGVNETISMGELPANGLTLYAIWLEANDTLQEWRSCDALEVNDVIALRDIRDDNTYAVAKLADGKCWTIENLRINDSVDADTMSAGSSTLGDGFSVLPASSNDWGINNTSIQFNDSNTVNGPSSYGNYYSWPAVIASTASYDVQTVNTSICPLGWRLPQGGQTVADSNSEYYILVKSLTNEEPNRNQGTGDGYYSGAVYSNAIRKYPYNFVYSGRWYDESASNRGESGFYWTATSQNATGTDAYYLYLNGTMIRPGNGHGGKYYGNAFRCIAE